jgi:acyl transferase domain-containing protein
VGGFVTDEWRFDWKRFRIPPADLAAVNPLSFATLAAGVEALADVRIPRETTAVVLGSSGLGYQRDSALRIHLAEMSEAIAGSAAFASCGERGERARHAAIRALEARIEACSSDNVVGSLASVAAARIAMHLDLYGPHYSVDADHASGLAALEIAVRGLMQHEWDCVLTGGVSELVGPLEHAAYAARGWISQGGAPRPFDPQADGTVLGEGAVVIALKRVQDAVRDGDRILAMVRACATASNDHRQRALESAASLALSRGRIERTRVRYVESGACGVVEVDLAESAAVRSAYGDEVSIGSAAKTLGHLRAASSSVGVLRAILALHEGSIPGAGANGGALSLGENDVIAVSASSFSGTAGHALFSRPLREHSIDPPSDSRRGPAQPTAIVGLGGIYAGAENAGRLWDGLMDARDQVREVPSERFALERYWSEDVERRERSYARKGSFVELPTPSEEELCGTDPRVLDPTHVLSLRAAQAAVADAGPGIVSPSARVATYVAFMPFFGVKWAADACVVLEELLLDLSAALIEEGTDAAVISTVQNEVRAAFEETRPPVVASSCEGWLASMMAGRIGSALGHEGTRVAIESACASTFAAIQAASMALRAGTCDVAIAGGAFADLAPEFYVGTSRFRGLSPGGIAPFDASAKGFVPGEGAGFVVLCRAADAEHAAREGRGHIRALITGIGGSSDGRGRSVLTPSLDGEALAMQRALAAAGIAPDDVAYVECHGTGTSLGDAVEAMALGMAYGGAERKKPLAIGSVKSNLGHLCAAAGAPALTKVVFALEREAIPPSLHFSRPSPKIDFTTCGLEVVTEPRPWPRDAARARTAGASAFGIGGSNFHVLIREHREPVRAAGELFTWSGASGAACLEAAAQTAKRIAAGASFALTAEETRANARTEAAFSSRLSIVASDGSTLQEKIGRAELHGAEPTRVAALAAHGIHMGTAQAGRPVVFAFPGQGPEYPGMLRELAEMPAIVRTLSRADTAWLQLTGRSLRASIHGVDAAPEAFGDETPMEDRHAAVLAVGVALAELLADHGIVPDMIVGQSAGELAALTVAGALTIEDALTAMHARSRAVLDLQLTDPGAMLVVSAGAERLTATITELGEDALWLAADNCPDASIATGATAAIAALARRCAELGIESSPLSGYRAYHSPIVGDARIAYRQALEGLTWRAPRVPVLSTVDLSVHDADHARTIDVLVAQLVTPVRLREAILVLAERGAPIFFECGPKWSVTTYIHQTLRRGEHAAHAAVHPKVGELEQLRRMLGFAFVHGVGWNGDADTPTGTHMSTAQKTPSRTPQASDVQHEIRQKVQEAVLAALVERTGYPADMLDLDLDLEGDLGIDTVKQVEAFSRVRTGFGLAPVRSFAMRDFNTVRKVIDHIVTRLAAGEGHAPQSDAKDSRPISESRAVRPVPRASKNPNPAGDRSSNVEPTPVVDEGALRSRIEARVIAALAERTGYPPEMLELDVDLEGELGIDTVKQVEAFSRVRGELGLSASRRVAVRELSTLRKVVDYLFSRVKAETGVPPGLVSQDSGSNAASARSPARSSARHSTFPGPSERSNTPRRAPIVKTRSSLPPPVPVQPSSASVRGENASRRQVASGEPRAVHRGEHPLLDQVFEHTADRVVVTRTFSLARDPWLRASVVGHRHAVPAGIAWELCAEAASMFGKSGAKVRAATDLVARGPLYVADGEACEVRIEAVRVHAGASGVQRVHARLLANDDGGLAVFHEGVFELGVPTEAVAPAGALRAIDRRGQPRNAHQLSAARDPVHLGETLAGCVWARSSSFREMTGGIEVDPFVLAPDAPDSEAGPQFVIAPGVLENAFALAGFAWFALTGLAGTPEALERLELGRAPLPSEELPCWVRLRESNASTVVADITVLGADRTLIAILRGARLGCLELPGDGSEREESVTWRRFFRAVQRPSEKPPR